MLNQRVHEAIKVLQGKRDPVATFNTRFLADVPPDQIASLAKRLQAENGPILASEDIRADNASTANFRIRFARGIAPAHLTLEGAAPFKVAGFRIGAALPVDDSPEKITADFAALPGRSGFAVARLDGKAPSLLASRDPDAQFAIGSTFKLWVLDALAEEVEAGRHRWDEVVRIGPRSLRGGITQDWPADAPVTIETLATLMISISDNTVTDTLIRLIGRERIAARVRKTGHSDPARMLPMLTTAEAFALKLGPAQRRDAYARADDADQNRILDALDAEKELAAADIAKLDSSPAAIDSIEWFASANDVVRVLDSLHRRKDPRVPQILGVAPNLDKAQLQNFAYAGYKGGSETGVLNLSWLLRRPSGEWFAVTASWNDPAAELDNAKLGTLAARLVALASRTR